MSSDNELKGKAKELTDKLVKIAYECAEAGLPYFSYMHYGKGRGHTSGVLRHLDSQGKEGDLIDERVAIKVKMLEAVAEGKAVAVPLEAFIKLSSIIVPLGEGFLGDLLRLWIAKQLEELESEADSEEHARAALERALKIGSGSGKEVKA